MLIRIQVHIPTRKRKMAVSVVYQVWDRLFPYLFQIVSEGYDVLLHCAHYRE